jgi:iron complex outermembrane receptor protein
VTGQDRQEDNTPEDTAAIFATKTLNLRSDLTLRYGGGVRWVGRQLAGDVTSLQVVTPSFTLADLVLAVEKDRWGLQVNADNLFNHYYYATCSQYGYCVNGERRTVNAAATYRFR